MTDEKTLATEFKACSDAIEASGGTLPVFKPADNIPQGHYRVAVIGDSLVGSAYPQQLEKILKDSGWDVSVQTLGADGRGMDYAVQAAKKLDSPQAGGPDLAVIALGGNDALYGIWTSGLSPGAKRTEMYEKMLTGLEGNLDGAVQLFNDKSIPVMVAGMKAPAVFPADIRNRFDKVFTDMAQKYGLVMDPFIMKAIVKDPETKDLSQIFHQKCMSDGIHPNTQGGELIAMDLAQEVQEALLKIAGAAEKRDPVVAAGVSNPPPVPGAGN